MIECRIYNWKELNDKYNFKSKNDKEVLKKILEKDLKILDEVEGSYAFGFEKEGKLILGRDKLGLKPLFYSSKEKFGFEKDKFELNPRKFLIFGDKIEFKEREFFKIKKVKDSKEKIVKKIIKLLEESVKKRKEKEIGLLFSGGIDSVVLALMLKRLKIKFKCYVCGVGNSEDVRYSKEISEELGLDLEVIEVKENEVEKYVKKIVKLVGCDVVKVGVALPLFIALSKVKEKVVFSGLGSEEIFAGYERHKKSKDINKECLKGLKIMYERDLYRDYVISKVNGKELRVPFLDDELIEYVLGVDGKYKVKNNQVKVILRDVGRELGLGEISNRKKRAAQYGSGFQKVLKKLSKKKGMYIKDYLREIGKRKKLCALVSSGKDSIYAMWLMMKEGYDVSCMIGIKSKNKDSFMFHSPVELVEKQSESMGIDLVMGETEGKKEDELKDLRKILEKAKEKGIEGIVTGALFSEYQKKRIEKVCRDLDLEVFSPLWHLDQELVMRQMIEDGFEFVLVKVAADGLNKKWLGNIIDNEDVDKLVELSKKNGLNVAGEGGEFESLVLNCPLFKKKLKIIKSKIKKEKDNIAELEIEEVDLI